MTIFFWKFATFISLETIRGIILLVNLDFDVALYVNWKTSSRVPEDFFDEYLTGK